MAQKPTVLVFFATSCKFIRGFSRKFHTHHGSEDDLFDGAAAFLPPLWSRLRQEWRRSVKYPEQDANAGQRPALPGAPGVKEWAEESSEVLRPDLPYTSCSMARRVILYANTFTRVDALPGRSVAVASIVAGRPAGKTAVVT